MFFAATKLFQARDPHLRRMVYLCIKDICPGSDEVRRRQQWGQRRRRREWLPTQAARTPLHRHRASRTVRSQKRRRRHGRRHSTLRGDPAAAPASPRAPPRSSS